MTTLATAWRIAQGIAPSRVYQWGDWQLYNNPGDNLHVQSLYVRQPDGTAWQRIRKPGSKSGWTKAQEINWPIPK